MKKYTIMFHNGLSYEDYESETSEKVFNSREEAESYLDSLGYDYYEYSRE